METINGRLLNWASILEPNTREQAERTAAMPFIHPHLALMPDAHLGKGATVGSVIPTEGAIIPAAVGVDIGCGMMAVRTQFAAGDLLPKDLSVLHGWIARAVPLSAGRYNKQVRSTAEPRVEELGAMPGADQANGIAGNWPLQLGSVGSGNHFIEVSLDEQGRVWLFLHSGSRGVGNKLASVHIRRAQEWCRERGIELADRDLAYLEEGTAEFDAYITALRWAQRFAYLNREEMMDRVVEQVGRFVKDDVQRLETVNCFAGETEVITRTGTRLIEALAGSEHELLTANGAWVKAPVMSFGCQEVSEIVLSRSGVLKTIRATAGHRWLLRTCGGREVETTTAELRPGDRLQFTFPRRPEGTRLDRNAAARGFVYGDGSATSKNRSLANFCGSKDAALLALFEGVGRPPRTYGSVTRIGGLPGAWKRERPLLDAAPSELYGWLAGYFAADGDVDKTGRPTLSSADREDLEFVRLACQAVGIGTFGIRSRMRRGYGVTATALHLVGLMRADLDPDFFLIPAHRGRFESGRGAAERRGWNVLAVRATGELTEVFCAVVEGTQSFALADNILTRNCHHNYTERERHYGREVWLSRKGAISARKGQPGLIPGSMGTASYVVAGKGDVESLTSSPHGAGRNHSRNAARRLFTRADLEKRMTGIAWGHSDAFLDEHPDAYKDIDVVMRDAADLVEIRHTLRQVVNVKGD